MPFRPHRGVYVIVEELGGDDVADALLTVPGVAGVWTFATDAALSSPRWTDGDRRITVAWLDDDPLAVAAGVAPLVAPRAGVEFAGPFETITPWEWDWFDR